MKKKIILMVSTLVCMLALCSCGKSQVDLNGLSETQLQSACEQTAGVLEGLDANESEQYYSYYASQDDGKIYADLMEQWIDVQPQIGDFVGYKDFSVTKAGKTISAVETISNLLMLSTPTVWRRQRSMLRSFILWERRWQRQDLIRSCQSPSYL